MADEEDEAKKKRGVADEERARALIQEAGFVREMDAKYGIDTLKRELQVVHEQWQTDIEHLTKTIEERFNNLGSMSAINAQRLERLEEKLDSSWAAISDKDEKNFSEVEHSVMETRLDLTRVEAQTKVLMDLNESNWLNNVLKLVENKQVRAVLLLGGGWIASTLGPDILKKLVELLG